MDVSNTPSQITATVEVDEYGGVRGNAQVKVQVSSTDKKKGATIENRTEKNVMILIIVLFKSCKM